MQENINVKMKSVERNVLSRVLSKAGEDAGGSEDSFQ